MMKTQQLDERIKIMRKTIKPQILFINNIKKILIYGAGPVGLVTAIQTTLQFPQIEIIIADLSRRFEKVNGKWKNLEFPNNQTRSRRRAQVITIRDDCRDMFPFLKNIFQKKFKNRIWGGISTNVPLRQLEDALMEEAQNGKFPNIKFQFTMEGSSKIKEKLEKQNFDLVVGCDGANSDVRQILAPQPSQKNLHPDCKVQGKKYVFGSDYILGAQVNQNMREYRDLNQTMLYNEKLYDYHAIMTITQMRLLLNAYYPPISNDNEEKGIQGFVNVRLSEKQYTQFKQAGQNKNVKCRFTDPAQIFAIWQRNFVQLKVSQKKILQSAFSYYGLDVTKNCKYIYLFELKPGYASKFAFSYKTSNKKQIPVFLCGDAAISHHFWPGRGLNTGLKSVSFLLDCLCYTQKQAIRYYNQNMQRLAKRQIVERSLNFCQFNGKGKEKLEQLSLFDKRNPQYIETNCPDLSKQQLQQWANSIYSRILQLKQGSLTSGNFRRNPIWPNLGLSTDKNQLNTKLEKIIQKFWLDPRNARYICKSGRWYRQGKQPQVFSRNEINRKYLGQYLSLINEKNQRNMESQQKQFKACVKGLSYISQYNDIKNFFRQCGEIIGINLLRRPDGKFKGIAFVKFKKRSSLTKALQLTGSEICGRRITVEEAKDIKSNNGNKQQGDFQKDRINKREFYHLGKYQDDFQKNRIPRKRFQKNNDKNKQKGDFHKNRTYEKGFQLNNHKNKYERDFQKDRSKQKELQTNNHRNKFERYFQKNRRNDNGFNQQNHRSKYNRTFLNFNGQRRIKRSFKGKTVSL